jgi:hypothetical protein
MWKANGKTNILLFLSTTFPKSGTNVRCYFWRQNNPEVNYHPIQISGRGAVFVEEISHGRSYWWIRPCALLHFRINNEV